MMRRALDTNVLVYATIPAFPEHEDVRRYLLSQLRQPEVRLAVTPNILHEFVHVTTDGRRFDPSLKMSEALEVARRFLNGRNIECLSITAAHLQRAIEMLEKYSLGRKRIADTLMAATLLDNDVPEIITCNSKDFSVFDGLTVIDPLQEV